MIRRFSFRFGPILAFGAALLLCADSASAQRGMRPGMRGGGPPGMQPGGRPGMRGGPAAGGERGPRGPRGEESRGGEARSRGADRSGGDDKDERTREQRTFDWVWSRVDKNQDGKITKDETGDDRLRRFMKDNGLDYNRTYTRDDWNQAAQRSYEKRVTEEENRGEEERRTSRYGRRDEGDGRDNRDRSRSSGGTYVRGGARDSKGRTIRITIELPSGFGDFDLDEDGQLGLYEWRQWNRTLLAEFLELDRDGDGYLTPRELVDADARDYARGESAALSNPNAGWLPSEDDGYSEDDQTIAESRASESRAEERRSSETSEPVELSSRDRAAAERYFKLLDRDKSGRISVEEWRRSSRLKPKFEAVGADLASELNLDAFVVYYGKTLQG